MEVTKKSRLKLRIENLAFVVLFLTAIGLLAWLSTRYSFQADWTAGGRNTLAEASRELLGTLDKPVHVSAYATENEMLRKRIQDLVGRYQRAKSDITLEFINPEAHPEETRNRGITTDGELVVAYDGREEQIQDLSEQALTNALQRVARGGERWVVFVEGHGERAPLGKANHDLGNFGQELERKGLTVQTVNLAKTNAIPENTTTLVLAGPRADFLLGEVKLVEDYLQKGGNLLWLGDPGELHGLQPLADRLGVTFLPGTIVDATTQLFGISNPSFALVADYQSNPITGQFDILTLFPQAAALDVEEHEDWHAQPFLETLERSWTETGDLQLEKGGEIRFDEGSDERAGPLTLGVALTRELKPATHGEDGSEKGAENGDRTEDATPAREQRVAVIGDGDFLSNAYLGNGGNLDLGLAVFQWLSHDDQFINIRAKAAPDASISLSGFASAAISIGFLFVLPLGLLAAGFAIWWRRRRR